MLPAANRMRRSTDFSTVVRAGRRVRERRLVLHVLNDHRLDGRHEDLPMARMPEPVGSAPLVGLIVGKSVGGSVVRHRVSRVLRAQLADRLSTLPAGTRTVVRGLPAAATATSADVGLDLDRALRRLATPAGRTDPSR